MDISQLIDYLTIDEYGYAIIIRLIETRYRLDISATRNQCTELPPSTVGSSGFFADIKRSYIENKKGKLDNNLKEKEIFFLKWLQKSWIDLENNLPRNQVESFKTDDIQLLVRKFQQRDEAKIYLILQEVVLTPLYRGEYEREKLKEINREHGFEVCSRLCGLPDNMGNTIIKRTDKLFKEATNFWGKLMKYTTAGIAILTVTAGLATPAIATAIGGAMGLSGAAAYSAGLAFLGGGAITAGGLGMAGGLSVLIGGGALLGAASGAGASLFLTKLPKEALLLSLIKLVDYAYYLNSVSDRHSYATLNQIKTHYLTAKHNVEREFLLENNNFSSEKVEDVVCALNFAYLKLVKL